MACYGPLPARPVGEGGEGGERGGGEAGARGLASVFAGLFGQPVTPLQEAAACLAMVEANLAAARALLAANNPGDASLNFRNAAQRYRGVDALLTARKAPLVKERLMALADQAARGATLAQVQAELDSVSTALAQATPAAAPPDLALAVTVALAKQLAARYAAAVDGEDLASEAIYQEAWALTQGVTAWVRRAEPGLRPSQAEAYAKLVEAAQRLAAALPQTPAATVVPPKAIYGHTLRIELRVRQLAKAP
jgi:hypothetical protein